MTLGANRSEIVPHLKYNVPQNLRVLIVSDNVGLLQLLGYTFSKIEAQTYTASDGLEGIRQFYDRAPNLVVLDLRKAGIAGLTLCQQIRQLSDIPIILLINIDQDEEIIRGLAYGADDYIISPFNPDILVAKVQAVLRRTGRRSATDKLHIYSDGYLTINLNKHFVSVERKVIKLSPKEYDLLVYLFQNADHILTFEQILVHVWGEEYMGSDQYVHVYIRYLRQKIEKDPSKPVYFLSAYGLGYYFVKQGEIPLALE